MEEYVYCLIFLQKEYYTLYIVRLDALEIN